MKILEILLAYNWQRTGTYYYKYEILIKEDKRILYDPKKDREHLAYVVGSIQVEDIQRLQAIEKYGEEAVKQMESKP